MGWHQGHIWVLDCDQRGEGLGKELMSGDWREPIWPKVDQRRWNRDILYLRLERQRYGFRNSMYVKFLFLYFRIWLILIKCFPYSTNCVLFPPKKITSLPCLTNFSHSREHMKYSWGGEARFNIHIDELHIERLLQDIILKIIWFHFISHCTAIAYFHSDPKCWNQNHFPDKVQQNVKID